MMKNLFQIFGAAALMLILTACPYKSKFPIDKPQHKINKDWCGVYFGSSIAGRNTDSLMSIIVEEHSDVEYKVECYYRNWEAVETKEKRDKVKLEDGQADEYIAHTSVIQGTTFVNALHGADTSYYLFKVEMEGANLTLHEFTPLLNTRATDQNMLKEIITNNLLCDLLFGDPFWYKKMR